MPQWVAPAGRASYTAQYERCYAARDWGLTPGQFYELDVWEQAAMVAFCRVRDKIAALEAEYSRMEAKRGAQRPPRKK